MTQQVGGLLVDAVRAGTLELLLAVPARQKPDAQGARSPRREQVPHAVADDDRATDVDAEPLGRRQERVGSGFACATWSRVTTGVVCGTPNPSSVGRALSM